MHTLRKVGAEDILFKSQNKFSIVVSKIDCDLYQFIQQDIRAINAYNGEYMTQYPWSELILASLVFKN